MMTHPGLQHGPKAGPPIHSLFDDGWQAVEGQKARVCGASTTDQIDPRHLFEMAKHQPLQAALECQKNLSVLENGYQQQRRRYIAISYAAAFYTAQDEAALNEFDQLLVKQRVIKKPNLDGTRERLIYRMFEVTFAKTGRSSSNTAYRYAHGLEHYFGSQMHPNHVANMLIEHGPEKLYKDAVKRNRNDVRHANMMHQRHLDRAKSDGCYAAKLLALDRANVLRATPKDDQTPVVDDEDDDVAFDDDDEEEEAPPSWLKQQIGQRFEKMVALAAQLSAEIAESKAVLDGTSDEADDDLLRDEDDVERDDWKTPEVQLHYDQVLRRAVQVGGDLVELKALLDARIK